MDQPVENIRILMLEDVPSDAELAESHLRHAGLVFTSFRVDTRDAFEQALDKFKPDIVLADYRLPAYNGRDALEYTCRTHPQIPVIMVTGMLGEEEAVDLLKMGARDYVLKDRLARLETAIKRVLSEDIADRNRKLAEEKYLALFTESMEGIALIDSATWRFVECNPEFEKLTGRTLEQLKEIKVWEVLPPEQHELVRQRLPEIQKTGSGRSSDLTFLRPDGELVPYEYSAKFLSLQENNYIQVVTHDISDRLRSEQALRESEARYKRITEGLTDYLYTVRIDNGSVIETTQSPACVKVTGYNSEEFATNPYLWIQMVVQEDRELVIDRLRQVMAGKDVAPMEHRIIRKDGEIRWVSDTIILFRDAFGRLQSYDGVIRDITERKQSEYALRESEEKFRSITASAQDAILMMDNEKKICYWNMSAEKIFGYPAQEALGQTLHELLAPERFHADFHKGFSRFQETGEGPIVGKTIELIGLRKDGTEFPIELSLSAIKRGGQWHAIGIVRDITERKQAEDLLRQERDFSDGIVETAQAVILVLSPQGRIVRFNQFTETLTGYVLKEVEGQEWISLFIPESDRKEVWKIFQRAINNLDIRSYVNTILTKDGRQLLIEWYSKTLADDKGKVTGLIGLGMDVTERKQAEMALQASEKRLQMAIRTGHMGVWELDLIDHTAYRSLEHDRIFGYESLLPKWTFEMFLEHVLPEDRSEVNRVFNEAVMTQTDWNFECRIRRIDGEVRWIWANGSHYPDIKGVIRRMIGIVQDITERKQSEEALRRANRALMTLSAGNLALVHAANEEELLRTVTKVIVEKGGYSLAAVGYAVNNLEKDIMPMAWAGLEGSHYWAENLSWANTEHGQLPISRAIRSGSTQICHDIASDPRFKPWRDAALARGLFSNIALPLSSGGSTFGVLSVYASEVDSFGDEEIWILEELANDLAYGIITLRTRIEHDQQALALRESLEQSIQTIAGTLEARDRYTAGHQRRVAELAVAIAREMGLPEEQVNGIHLAAIIHDLGKIQVPAEILSKPARLTEIEFMLIKTHPQAGYDILKGVKFPWPIADIILQHHERLDGSGYPQGLKDEQLLLEAKIIAIADVVEAIVSHRPYRPAMGIETALNEIKGGRAILYDPLVVDTCLRLIVDKGFQFSSLSIFNF